MNDINKIETLYELSKYDEVIKKCIEDLYKQDSDKETLYHYLIASLLNQKEDETALKFCLSAKKDFPLNSNFIYFHSKISLINKQMKDAIKYINEALKIEPNNSKYHYHFCQIYIEQKKYVDAKKAIDKALELDSSNLDYHLANALILYMLDGEKVAREIVDEVLCKNPNHEYALYLKQGLFTSKLKDRKSILKGLLSKNPFDKDYQGDMKFIKFYYRYIPILMLLIIGLSFLVHSNRRGFGFLENWIILLFFIVGMVGSHDWRFNVPFIIVLLIINTYYTNIPDGLEITDIFPILFLGILQTWVFYTMYYILRGAIRNTKEKLKGKT